MFRPKQGPAVERMAVRQHSMALAVNIMRPDNSKSSFHLTTAPPINEFERVFKRA